MSLHFTAFQIAGMICLALALAALALPQLHPAARERRSRGKGFGFWVLCMVFFAAVQTAAEDSNAVSWTGTALIGALIIFLVIRWQRPAAAPKAAPAAAPEKVEAACENFSNTAAIPAFEETGEVPEFVKFPSFSEKGVFYTLSPVHLTCTCPDFEKRRAEIPAEDPARLCKHLVIYFSRNKAHIPSALARYAAIIHGQALRFRGMPLSSDDHECHEAEINGRPAYYYRKEFSPWVNVLDGNEEFGFSLAERRWSRNKAPDDADEHARNILRLFDGAIFSA